MLSARVRCHGCNKAFTPYGLAQHGSKSPNTYCRASNNPTYYRFMSLPIPYAAHPLGPLQISTSGDSQDPQSGNEYDLASDQDSDDVSDLGRHSSAGGFIMTHVPEKDGDIFPSRSDPLFYS
jgi:hypothetical protein